MNEYFFQDKNHFMQIEKRFNLEDINLNWVLRLPEILKYTERKIKF